MDNPFTNTEDLTRRLPNIPPTTITDFAEDAWARATEAAPCLAADDFPSEKQDLVKTLLRAVILRWAQDNIPQSDSSATTRVAGPYQMTVEAPQRKGFRLTLGETVDFTKLCQKPGTPFTIHTDIETDEPTRTVHPFLTEESDF
ncbi:hypothetical protein [Mycobacteroides abscessus]